MLKPCKIFALIFAAALPLMAAQIDMAWDASVSTNVVSYAMYRLWNTNWQFAGGTTGLTMTVTAPTNGTYVYAVKAESLEGPVSDFSNMVTARVVTVTVGLEGSAMLSNGPSWYQIQAWTNQVGVTNPIFFRARLQIQQ